MWKLSSNLLLHNIKRSKYLFRINQAQFGSDNKGSEDQEDPISIPFIHNASILVPLYF